MMSTNSVEAIDTILQKTNAWLNDLMEDLAWDNRHWAHLSRVMDFPPLIPEHVLASIETVIAAAQATVQQVTLTSDTAFRHASQTEGSELNHIDEAGCIDFAQRRTCCYKRWCQKPRSTSVVGLMLCIVSALTTDTALHADADAVWAQYDTPHDESARIEASP